MYASTDFNYSSNQIHIHANNGFSKNSRHTSNEGDMVMRNENPNRWRIGCGWDNWSATFPSSNSAYFFGDIFEARSLQATFTDGEYDIMNDISLTGKFWKDYSVSKKVANPLVGWENATEISAIIHHEDVPSEQTDFPVRIRISNESGKEKSDLTDIIKYLMKSSEYDGSLIKDRDFGAIKDGTCNLNMKGSNFVEDKNGEPGGAMEFSRVPSAEHGGYVVFPENARWLLASKKFSCSFWVRFDDRTLENTAMHRRSSAFFGVGYTREIEFYLESRNRLVVRCGYGNTSYYNTLTTPYGTLVRGKWIHIFYERDKDYSNINRIYINGRSVSSATMSRNITLSTEEMRLGCVTSWGDHRADCRIADFQLYNQPLREDYVDDIGIDNILELYQGQKNKFYKDKFACVIFNQKNDTVPLMLGEDINSIQLAFDCEFDDTCNSVAFSNDMDTFYIYKNSTWSPIVTSDESIHGFVGDSSIKYLEADGSWAFHSTDLASTLAYAFSIEANRMSSQDARALTNVEISEIYDPSNGLIDIAIGMKNKDEANIQALSEIGFNNQNIWTSKAYDLEPYTGDIELVIPEVNYRSLNRNDKITMYYSITGSTEWIECESGENITALTGAQNTIGVKLQFKLVYDSDSGIYIARTSDVVGADNRIMFKLNIK